MAPTVHDGSRGPDSKFHTSLLLPNKCTTGKEGEWPGALARGDVPDDVRHSAYATHKGYEERQRPRGPHWPHGPGTSLLHAVEGVPQPLELPEGVPQPLGVRLVVRTVHDCVKAGAVEVQANAIMNEAQ
jgi:hypothetical protein